MWFLSNENISLCVLTGDKLRLWNGFPIPLDATFFPKNIFLGSSSSGLIYLRSVVNVYVVSKNYLENGGNIVKFCK